MILLVKGRHCHKSCDNREVKKAVFYFLKAGTDEQTSESHHISCGGSGDVIGQALCKSEQVTGRHTGLGYDSVLFPIAEEVEEEEGEKETQDSNSKFRQSS